jgi:DNA-binding transcriptional ArsR family regulator
MITVELDAQGLGSVRFAISQCHTAVDSLMMLRGDAPAGYGSHVLKLRATLRARGLALTHALFCGPATYIPDFMAPHPPSYERSVEECLHAVATADPGQVREELSIVLDQAARSGRALPRPLLLTLEHGEHALAESVAAELAQVWKAGLAEQWPNLRALSEADITHRTQSIARHGIAATLASLAPEMDYTDGRLRVFEPAEATLSGVRDLVLLPRVFGHRPGVDATRGADGRPAAAVWYRQRPAGGPGRFSSRSQAQDLLGPTRAAVLADLSVPRSTGELARRQALSPSTVSYHLSILHRSGLVTRLRDTRHVMYRQTHRAAQLLGD